MTVQELRMALLKFPDEWEIFVERDSIYDRNPLLNSGLVVKSFFVGQLDKIVDSSNCLVI